MIFSSTDLFRKHCENQLHELIDSTYFCVDSQGAREFLTRKISSLIQRLLLSLNSQAIKPSSSLKFFCENLYQIHKEYKKAAPENLFDIAKRIGMLCENFLKIPARPFTYAFPPDLDTIIGQYAAEKKCLEKTETCQHRLLREVFDSKEVLLALLESPLCDSGLSTSDLLFFFKQLGSCIQKLNMAGREDIFDEEFKNIATCCPNLKELDISDTNIKTLKGLENCKKLQIVLMKNSRVENLYGLNNCKDLIEIDATNAKIKNLHGLEECIELQTLRVRQTRITSIDELKKCSGLLLLDISKTSITKLDALTDCMNLRELHLENTKACKPEALNVLSHIPNLKTKPFIAFLNGDTWSL